MTVKTDLADILIDDNSFQAADKFSLLRRIAEENDPTNDLAILIAMRLAQREWQGYEEIAIGFVRAKGLFPYLTEEKVGEVKLRDAIAREIYRSPTRAAVFMHRAQYSILNKLLAGDSIILSAPTSFGKSFLIEELLLSGKFNNILIVVPTVALIEELRQKIKRLNIEHQRISFTNQVPGEKNVFILTQERAYEMYGAISAMGVDLLIIDEFYKMDEDLLEKEDGGDRANMLSVVYRKFSEIAKQVYLLGPYIDGANGYKTAKHDPIWIESTDNTTYIVRKHIVAKAAERSKKTLEVVMHHKKDVMIYCSSPATLRDFYKEALHESLDTVEYNDDLIEWITENIGQEWYLIDALKRGVGIHHGKLPRFLAHEMIKRFGDGRLNILLCTSSLIEGVNTSAKTIVIHNGKQRFPGDILSFRNISGRAGRMFNHFWGTVYYYEEPNSSEQIIVNDPIGSDKTTASPSMLSLLDDDQLSDRQVASVNERRGTTYIPDELLRLNHFIDISLQEEVLQKLNSDVSLKNVFSQIRTPALDSSQIKLIFNLACMLGLNSRKYAPSKGGNVPNSIIRLTIFIEAFFRGGFRALAGQQGYDKPIDDSAIEKAFYFLKNGMNYDFPKYIRAVDRLQKYTYGSSTGDLEPFANRLEFLDTHPVYVQLDELGLPIEFSKKYLLPSSSTDAAVAEIKRLTPKLDKFERTIAEDLIARY